jgi:hypothetical protein
MPACTFDSEPPLASADAMTTETAEFDASGLPLIATLPRYSGFFRSANVFGGFGTSVLL